MRFAATHSGKPAALALLAIGDPPSIREARSALPEIDDYLALLLASADLGASDFEAAAQDAESGLRRRSSPVEGRLALAAAQAYSKLNRPAAAIRVLRAHYSSLAQPDGDATLAAAYTAAGEAKNAEPYWTRIWLDFPASTQAKDAEAALGSVSATPRALLERASKLLAAHDYVHARAGIRGHRGRTTLAGTRSRGRAVGGRRLPRSQELPKPSPTSALSRSRIRRRTPSGCTGWWRPRRGSTVWMPSSSSSPNSPVSTGHRSGVWMRC